jgi:hypothetical protein
VSYRKIWTILRKLLKNGVNTEHLDPDRCFRHFAALVTHNINEILLKEVQILDPGHIDKPDDVFTTRKVKNFILRMKNNKALGCGGLPSEVWWRLVIKDEGIQILMKLMNTIRYKRVFLKEYKTALIQPVYKGNSKELGNYRGILLLPALEKIYSGLLAHRLRDWLMYYKKLALFQTGLTKGRKHI